MPRLSGAGMPDIPPFDPMAGIDYHEFDARAVFPDGERLIAETLDLPEVDGRADEYRVVHVPDSDLFILYGVYEARQVIYLISIRAYTPANN